MCGSDLYALGESYSDPQHTGNLSVNGWGGTRFPLDSQGTIGTVHLAGFGVGPQPEPMGINAAIDGTCTHVFHANPTSNEIVGVGWSGSSVMGYPGVTGGAGPVDIVGDPSFKFVYTANSIGNDVTGFGVDLSTMTFTPIPGSPFSAGSTPSSMIVVGGHLYVTNAGDNTVSAYTVDSSTGVLTPVAGSPFGVGAGPSGMGAARTDLSHSPTGSLLYVANGGSNNISAFIVQTDGALQPVNGSPFAAGTGPRSMVVATGPQ
jgi:hypothetical protein